jgi:hypothetical protein
MYTGIITNIRDIKVSGEFKILKFTVNRQVDEFLATEVTYEIPPSLKTAGLWVPTDDSIFEEQELKDLINNHLQQWPEDLRLAYEANQDAKELKSVVQQNVLSNEEIDAILRELL